MTPSEIKAAREKYSYVPARLIRASDHVAADLSWKSIKLIMDVPKGWDATHLQTRLQYSSCKLDNFHDKLLQSENDDDLVQGLLSVVFWGFSSGADGRLNVRRALSRARAIVFGRKNAPPQPENEIIAHIRRSRELLHASRIAEALLELRLQGLVLGSAEGIVRIHVVDVIGRQQTAVVASVGIRSVDVGLHHQAQSVGAHVSNLARHGGREFMLEK